jgi:hypothetical protein
MTRLRCSHHCRGCHSCFSSLEAFDAHRVGDHAEGRYCLDLDSCEAVVVKFGSGLCDLTGPEAMKGVVVWASARAIGRAEAAFEPTSGLGVERETVSDASGRVLARVAV